MKKKGTKSDAVQLPATREEFSWRKNISKFTSVYLSACQYMVENRSTIRESAKMFGLSKSTLHKFIHYHLQMNNRKLYHEVLDQIEQNLAVRHIRGGQATARKYARLRRTKRK